MTLSQEDQDRVRAEETLRLEVQEQIRGQRERSGREQVWSFLNSSFGIWLLSSVVLAFVVNIYSYQQRLGAAEKAKIEITRRADIEVSRRLRDLAHEITRVRKNSFDPARFFEATSMLREPDHRVFVQFKERKLSSVLWELGDSVSAAEIKSVNQAFKAALQIEELAHESPTGLDKDGVKSRVDAIEAELCSGLADPRWTRGRGFVAKCE